MARCFFESLPTQPLSQRRVVFQRGRGGLKDGPSSLSLGATLRGQDDQMPMYKKVLPNYIIFYWL